jgi:hypothetical protein
MAEELFGTDLDATRLDAVRTQRRTLRSALGALEGSIAAPSMGRADEWTTGVLERLVDLKDAFVHHIVTTEGPDGLFEDVSSAAPRLIHRIDGLRDEHHAITDALMTALSGPHALDPGSDVSVLQDRAVDVMGQVVRHRTSGADLIYEAYFVDIDAAD